jgi:hypothetical protein
VSARLVLGGGFELPIEAVTQTFGILGKRGVGKTATAGVMAEEMLERGLQVVVIDPIGVWWGLRTSASGRGQGYPILVLGGDHGDLPLEPSAGRLVADFAVSKRASAVLDLGLMSKGDQARFVADFLERLYHANRAPLHLFIDEADAFAPQRLHAGIQRCFGAVDGVVRRGRARGIGVTLVTQRSAAINKDVLTQIEVLVAFRTIAPQDRAAIEAWVEVHGDEAGRKAMLGSLHELKVGECWIWSPAWLEVLRRVQVRRRRTFDSSATPEVGRAAAAPRAVAAVDVATFRTELAALISKAEQEDPRRLRARVAQLEAAARVRQQLVAQLQKRPAAAPARVEVPGPPALRRGELERLEALAGRLEKALTGLAQVAQAIHLRQGSTGGFQVLGRESAIGAAPSRTTLSLRPPAAGGPRFVRAMATSDGAGGVTTRLEATAVPEFGPGEKMAGGERKILTALAQHGEGSADRVAIVTGYAAGGGGFGNYLGALRGRGLVEGGRDRLRITAAGLEALGTFEPLPAGAALLDHWNRQLGKAERAVLAVLVPAYPAGVDRAEVAARAGYAADGGGFNNALGRLRTLGLIEGRAELRACPALAEA